MRKEERKRKKISKNYFIDIFFHTQQVSHDTMFGNVRLFFHFLSLSFFFCLLLSPPRPHRSFRLNEACENVVVQKEIFSITWSRARLDFMIHSSTTPTDRCKVGSRSLSLPLTFHSDVGPASQQKDISTLSHFFIWCGYPSVLISCCCRLRAYWGGQCCALLHRNGSFLLLSRSALWNYSLSCSQRRESLECFSGDINFFFVHYVHLITTIPGYGDAFRCWVVRLISAQTWNAFRV